MESSVLLVEDKKDLLGVYSNFIRDRGFLVVEFSSPDNCLEYLLDEKRMQVPEVSFVDMRLKERDTKREEARKIYEALKKRDCVDQFYFMTMHISPQDRELARETKRPIIQKVNFLYRARRILTEYKENR